jgi:hypothetical protein
LDGKEWALMGCNNGIAFVDIQRPREPGLRRQAARARPERAPPSRRRRRSGRVEAKHGVEGGESLWRDVRVYSNYAYVGSEAAGHGLQVFDLTQLRSVTSPPVVFEETNHYDGYGHSHTTAVNADTGFIYAAGSDTCNGGLHMVDVSDPAEPRLRGMREPGRLRPRDRVRQLRGTDADYAGHELCFNANEDTLTIVDVTDKSGSDPDLRDRLRGIGYTHQAWLADGHRYLLPRRRARRGRRRPQQLHVHLGPRGPRRAGPHGALHRSDDGDRPQPVHQGPVRVRVPRTGPGCASSTSPASPAPRCSRPPTSTPSRRTTLRRSTATGNNYPFFASGNVILSDIEQGLFIVHPNLNPNPTALAIGDTQVTEGDSGTPVATFTVTLTNPVPSTGDRCRTRRPSAVRRPASTTRRRRER